MMPARRILRFVAIAAALLVTIDTAAWWWLSTRVVQAFSTWQQRQITDGHAIATGPPRLAGWPFWPGAVLPNVVMATAAAPPNGITWRAAALQLTYEPWHPEIVTAAATGTQSLQLATARAIPFTAAQLAATIPLDPAQPGGVLIEARQLATQLPTGTLTAERLSLHLQQHDVAIALDWGPLQARVAATLILEAGLQPQATGTIRLTGFQELLDALLHAGTITQADATLASAMLGLLATSEPGQPRQILVPLHLQDAVLSAGAVPLLRVPELTLP